MITELLRGPELPPPRARYQASRFVHVPVPPYPRSPVVPCPPPAYRRTLRSSARPACAGTFQSPELTVETLTRDALTLGAYRSVDEYRPDRVRMRARARGATADRECCLTGVNTERLGDSWTSDIQMASTHRLIDASSPRAPNPIAHGPSWGGRVVCFFDTRTYEARARPRPRRAEGLLLVAWAGLAGPSTVVAPADQ
ncbi:hypothetical protein L226DRAFT_326867 [Lentinus tigrinus ALCF2SS1-7]|uniref:uncharacterized protein n=1 Tax=Lentinus tigrinus ALCF2SS1-7 TaxID=1328758 RepID=UPI001165E648|nr:hypothetical protein L226DRAFT_326867 [Lentinus tigrinus ALCF2SS1-7]